MVALPFAHLALKTPKPRNPAYPEHIKTLGDHLRARRLDLGMHQKDVAALVNATTSTITNWEKGRTSPTLELMPKVIEFLGYNPTRAQEDTWGQRMKRIRIERGFSLKVLASKLGVDPQTVASWEEGRSQPDRRLIRRTTIIFGKLPQI